MKQNRRLALVLAACAVAYGTPGFAQPAGADLARTPWGDPDLQGHWNNNTLVPMERPANLAERDSLTDEEVAERSQTWSERLFTIIPGNVGFYNEFWFEYGLDTNRTSLVIDRPDGKLPALTPRAAELRQAISAKRLATSRAPATYLDHNLADRCLTRGMPGAMTPGLGYNHNYHILQTPDYVAINVELIHDTRIIPLDGRPHPSPNIGQWLGDSRGHWEGDALVVETTNLTDKITERNGGPTVFGVGENRPSGRALHARQRRHDRLPVYGRGFHDLRGSPGPPRSRCTRSRGRSSSTRATRVTIPFPIFCWVRGPSTAPINNRTDTSCDSCSPSAYCCAAVVPTAAGQEHPGAEPFQRVCQSCHGPEGRGDLAPRLVPLGFDVNYVLAVVREGYGQMPPISQRELPDDAVRQAFAYLELLSAQTQTPSASYDGPRTQDGRPDLNGIWQVLSTAAWDLRAHNARDGIPAGLSVVEGGEIPYQPWAAAQQQAELRRID